VQPPLLTHGTQRPLEHAGAVTLVQSVFAEHWLHVPAERLQMKPDPYAAMHWALVVQAVQVPATHSGMFSGH
jgi:hypothetical protein